MEKLYRPLPDDQGRISKLVLVYNTNDIDGELSLDDQKQVLNYLSGIISAFNGEMVEFFIVVDDYSLKNALSYRAISMQQAKKIVSTVNLPANIKIQYVLLDKKDVRTAAEHNAGDIPDQFIQDYIHPLEFIKPSGTKDILLLYTALAQKDTGSLGASYWYSLAVNARLANYENIFTMSVPLIIEGGNTLFFRSREKDTMLTGSTNISFNKGGNAKPSPIFAKSTPMQGEIICQCIKNAFGADEIEIIQNFEQDSRVEDGGYKNCLQHIDMFITPAGLTSDGRQKLLVAEMDEKYTYLLQKDVVAIQVWPDLFIRQKAYLQDVASRLEKKYVVVRIPMPLVLDIKTPSFSYLLSYNNCIVEIYRNTRKIFLPSYVDVLSNQTTNQQHRPNEPDISSSIEFLYENLHSNDNAIPNLQNEHIITLNNKEIKFSELTLPTIITAKYNNGRTSFFETATPSSRVDDFIPGHKLNIAAFEKNELQKILSLHFNDIKLVPWQYNQQIKDHIGSLHCLTKVIQRE